MVVVWCGVVWVVWSGVGGVELALFNSFVGGNALLLHSCYKESNHYYVFGVNNTLFRGKSPQ